MACFPRWMRHQKSSFSPGDDDNKDTILQNRETSVQIGRYVKREENPFFVPKSNEQRSNAQQFKRHSPQEGGVLRNKTSHNNNNNNKQTPSNINTVNKKFMSRKLKNNNINSLSTKENSSNTDINTNTITKTVQVKFRPVKERRPTALPGDVVHLNDEHDDDEYVLEDEVGDGDGDGGNDEGNVYDVDDDGDDEDDGDDVDFFDDDDVDDYDDTDDTDDETYNSKSVRDTEAIQKIQQNGTIDHMDVRTFLTSDGNNSNTLPTLQSVKFFIGQQDSDADSWDAVSRASASANSNRLKPMKETTTTTTVTTPTSQPKYSLKTSIDHPKHTKRDPRSFPSSVSNKAPNRTRRNAPDEVLNIPPPPPLPPQLLTSASSSASLLSQKLTRAAAHSSRSTSSTKVPGDKDGTPSPKDSGESSSPKSHRVEGGLIFTRPNLPVKKDAKIDCIGKDNKTRNLIRTAIEKNDFLNNYMDNERKEMVIDSMAPASYEQDSFIIHENEEGSEIFVSQEGYFDVIKAGQVIGTLGPGTVFGELAILYNAKRFASIKATTHANVWKIDRETFRNIMVISGSRERQENLNFLRSAPFLQDLSEDVLDRVVDLLRRKFFETNTCIVREGEVGNDFFIIRGGTVTIKKRNEYGVERIVDRRKRGDYFGEQALLNADRRQASVYADAPGTECLKLDREAFISYLGTIPQLREKPVEREVEGRVSNRKSEFQDEYASIDLSELKQVATLGAGAFGRVDLVSYRDRTFALKIIKKIDIVKQDQVEHVYSEKHVMMKCRSSPFIIELYKTFRNDKFVFFLLEACMGGDVWTVMSQRRFFDEKTARFISACVVEAFDFLHSHNIIYRDLKPENLMLTTDGYCKLVDFGFAKHVPTNQKTNTFAGTPEYVAPEIILDRGHDRSVDYWALGILIFELLVGKTPFRGQNQIKIYQQILGGIDVIQMPSKIPKSAQSIIKHLCKQLPVERLGYQRKGILDIKKHSWFDGLDWNKLKAKQLQSPIKRPITSNTDTQYFVPCGPEHEHDPPDETSGWDADF